MVIFTHACVSDMIKTYVLIATETKSKRTDEIKLPLSRDEWGTGKEKRSRKFPKVNTDCVESMGHETVNRQERKEDVSGNGTACAKSGVKRDPSASRNFK